MERILIIGGTGMLRELVLDMAAKGAHLTLVTRHRAKMEALAQNMDNPLGKIHFIEADYRNVEHLRTEIGLNMKYFGPFDKVIAWIHAQGYHTHVDIAELTARPSLNYYQILGSMSKDPHAAPDKVAEEMRRMDMKYHQLVLGFVIEKDQSRWLTDDEICDGIKKALNDTQEESIIGTVEPWSKHP